MVQIGSNTYTFSLIIPYQYVCEPVLCVGSGVFLLWSLFVRPLFFIRALFFA